MNYAHEYIEQFNACINHIKQEIGGLRTGRASPALVEDIQVEAYGSRQPIKALASIMVSDPKTLVVDPWDKSVLAAIEAGIRDAKTGLNPVSDGKIIRIPLAQLTSERRQELIKVLHQKLEAARISIRQIREEVKQLIDEAVKNKEVGEDDKFKQQEDLDAMVKEYNEKIKLIGEEKEKEITTI